VPTSRATRVTSAGEAVELVDHRVDGFLQLQDFAAHVDRDLARQVALGDGGRDFGDVAHLRSQVRRERVDRVGQILPRAGDAGHDRLAAELAFGADLARDARDFRSEAAQLVDHRVDGFLQLQNFAAHVDRDLARQVAVRDRDRNFGNVAHLRGQVVRHLVDRVGQVLPGAGDAGHLRLAAEQSGRADFARDARDLGCETVELVDHRVDRFLQLQHFAAHVDRDLARQVALGDRGRHLGDVAHLRGQIRRKRVDRVGQVLPRASHARHDRLAAELAFGADFARHARDFRSEAAQLVDHRVDSLLQLQDFAAHVDRDLARQVAVRDGDRHLGDVAHLRRQVVRHLVDRIGQVLPHAGHALGFRLAAEQSGRADFDRDARDFGAELLHLLDHAVDDVGRALELAEQRPAVGFERHRARQVALGHAGHRFGHRFDRAHQIVNQTVDRLFHLGPGALAVRRERGDDA
jgi:hypothetical protein